MFDKYVKKIIKILLNDVENVRVIFFVKIALHVRYLTPTKCQLSILTPQPGKYLVCREKCWETSRPRVEKCVSLGYGGKRATAIYVALSALFRRQFMLSNRRFTVDTAPWVRITTRRWFFAAQVAFNWESTSEAALCVSYIRGDQRKQKRRKGEQKEQTRGNVSPMCFLRCKRTSPRGRVCRSSRNSFRNFWETMGKVSIFYSTLTNFFASRTRFYNRVVPFYTEQLSDLIKM